MDFRLLENLDFENYEFKATEIVLTNALIYDDYFYCTAKNSWNNVTDIPLPSRIYRSDNIKYKGNLVFDSNTLLDRLSYFFNKICKLCSDNEITDFIQNKSSNADFNREMLSLFEYNKLNQKPNDEILNTLIDFFKEFGFSSIKNSKEYLSIINAKYSILSKMLILSFINKIYENITLLISDDMFEKINLQKKLDEVIYIINLLLGKNITKIKISDEKSILLYEDFKIDLLNIVNKFTLFFGPVSLYSYIDFSDGKNKVIYFSDNIFSIAWYLIVSKIQTSFMKGKKKKCVDCRQNYLSNKQSNKMYGVSKKI